MNQCFNTISKIFEILGMQNVFFIGKISIIELKFLQKQIICKLWVVFFQRFLLLSFFNEKLSGSFYPLTWDSSFIFLLIYLLRKNCEKHDHSEVMLLIWFFWFLYKCDVMWEGGGGFCLENCFYYFRGSPQLFQVQLSLYNHRWHPNPIVYLKFFIMSEKLTKHEIWAT